MAHRLTCAAAALFCAHFLPTAASASYIDVTVSTEKSTYSPGEALHFHVTARNTTDQALTLYFGSALQAQYVIDGTSPFPHFGAAIRTQRPIPAHGSATWTFRSPPTRPYRFPSK